MTVCVFIFFFLFLLLFINDQYINEFCDDVEKSNTLHERWNYRNYQIYIILAIVRIMRLFERREEKKERIENICWKNPQINGWSWIVETTENIRNNASPFGIFTSEANFSYQPKFLVLFLLLLLRRAY